jgi:hypothetical protein
MASDSSLLILYLILEVAGGFFYLYGTILSFSISRALAVPIYRSRALWTGFIGAFILFFSVDYVFGQVATVYQSTAIEILYLVLLPIIFVAGFIWIDRTIGVLILLDQLRRDILGWTKKRFRIVYWTIFVVQIVFYYLLSLNTSVLVFEYVWFAFYAILLIYSSLAIVIGSRRTADATFKSHVRWFGYFIVTSLVVSILSLILSILTGSLIEPYLAAILSSYFFYRMARSLVPLNRISLVDTM